VPPGDWKSDEPLANISSRNLHRRPSSVPETGRCGYEEVSGHARCDFMVKLTMRRHVLTLFSGEHIEKVLVHLGDDFGKTLPPW